MLDEFLARFYQTIFFGPGEPFPAGDFRALFRPDALLLGWILSVCVGGVLPAVFGVILAKKPSTARAVAAVVVVCALVGAIAFRADMWTAAQFVHNFFSPL